MTGAGRTADQMRRRLTCVTRRHEWQTVVTARRGDLLIFVSVQCRRCYVTRKFHIAEPLPRKAPDESPAVAVGSEPVERVARALMAHDDQADKWEQASDGKRDYWLNAAREALDAL